MSKTKTNYEEQKIELAKKFANKELGHIDLIDMLVAAREQRDNYKTTIKKFKKANHNLADKIINAKKHLRKADKFLILN